MPYRNLYHHEIAEHQCYDETSNMSCHALRGSASWASPGADGGVSNHPPSLSFWPWKASAVWALWGGTQGCWTLSAASDRGLGDAHRAPAIQIAEWECFEEWELFETWVGVCAMVYHPMGLAHRHTADLSFRPPGNLMYFASVLC